jgi:hypothetical protein
MSNITVIGVIGALFIGAGFLLHHIIITFNRKNLEITSGVAQGVPMLSEMRWRTLWQVQVSTVAFMGAFSLVMAFLFLAIGGNVDDAHIGLLAQSCAWIYLSFSALWLIAGPAAIAVILRLLRQAEAD